MHASGASGEYAACLAGRCLLKRRNSRGVTNAASGDGSGTVVIEFRRNAAPGAIRRPSKVMDETWERSKFEKAEKGISTWNVFPLESRMMSSKV
jgi:hypothetical protein